MNEVPVLQAMAVNHTPAQIFFDGVHTTTAANQRIAEALAAKIEPWLRSRPEA